MLNQFETINVYKKNSNSKNSKIIIVIAFSIALSICYFISCSQYTFQDYVYNVSPLNLIVSKWFDINGILVPIPVEIRTALTLGFLLNLTGMLLVIKKTRLASLCFMMSSLSFLILLCSGALMHNQAMSMQINQFSVGYFSSLFFAIFLGISAAVLSMWSISDEALGEAVFKSFSFVSIGAVIIITFYIFISGIPAISEIGILEFLLGTQWDPKQNIYGIAPLILSSIVASIGAILLGVPIGIFTAIFLSEIANSKLATLIRVSVQMLAGIPSVLYGFFGMTVIVPLIRNTFPGRTVGDSMLASILILSVMILPTIISVSENSLRAVPTAYREAALALGATPITTIFGVTVPAASSGLLSGVILGVGRAIGETMAVIMVAGNVVNMPSILKPVRLLTTGIVLEMSYSSGLHRQALFAIGLILFIFITIVNVSFMAISKKGVYVNEM